MRLLVIEDEARIVEVLRPALGRAGFTVDAVGTAADARAALSLVAYDAAILDLGLPDGDGLDLLVEQRRGGSRLPVLVLTARDAVEARVVGLDTGADDYLTKPFSPRELVARVRALLRRASRAEEAAAAGAAPEQVGGVELDRAARRVRRDGEVVHLTPTEFDLLACLAARSGTVLTRTQLLTEVWGYRDGSGIRTVDSHVRALRRKLGDGLVRTVHGVGYSIEPRP